MKASDRAKSKELKASQKTITHFVVGGVAIILLLIPFHAFITVWAASMFGHYTGLRLWKEFLLIPLACCATWLALHQKTLRHALRTSWLLRLMLAYILVQFLLGIAAYERHTVNAAALAEGLIDDTRPIVFFMIALIAATESPWLRANWKKVLLIPAVIVVGFGLLQAFVLPAGFLEHFGYSKATIPPYQLVDLNSSFVRVQSFLRGANPLGAYLVLIISTLVAASLGLRGSKPKAHYAVISGKSGSQLEMSTPYSEGPSANLVMTVILAFMALIVLYFTYSRSAYIGTGVAVFIVGWLSVKKSWARHWLLAAALVLCVAAAGTALLLRHNARFEDTFFHTSQLSHSAQSSNQNRTSALEGALHDVLHEPFGHGPGTAGPASEHNNHPPRIAENYFLQIGQETGWLGLILFVVINLLVAKELWRRRNEPDKLPLILFASLIGLTLVNLLSLAWTDDTLAYLWWGLAGITLTPILQSKAERK